MWRTIKDEKVPDLKAFLEEATKQGQLVHIGTDSLQTGKYTQFCTVIAILLPGKGGRALYKRLKVKRMDSMRERLFKEVWLSVTLALEVSPIVKGELTVHIDANPVVVHGSSKYVHELVGMVVSQGFKAAIKPESWAASHAADFVVRHLGRLPREPFDPSEALQNQNAN